MAAVQVVKNTANLKSQMNTVFSPPPLPFLFLLFRGLVFCLFPFEEKAQINSSVALIY